MPDNHNTAATASAGFQHHGAPESACHVCGQQLAGRPTALCAQCDRPFHLQSRQDGPDNDCGTVWLNEQYLAMDFACDVCLGKRGAWAGEEPPIASGH